MINRINLILQAKNITAKQFAEEIGIQPSGMSHILGGRNNPSLEFVSKVLRRYPEIDANWLLLGRGQMYGTAPQGGSIAPEVPSEPTLFGASDVWRPLEVPAAGLAAAPEVAPQPSAYAPDAPAEVPAEAPISPTEEPVFPPYRTEDEPSAVVSEPQARYAPSYIAVPPESDEGVSVSAKGTSRRRAERIYIMYSDRTFAEYTPAE